MNFEIGIYESPTNHVKHTKNKKNKALPRVKRANDEYPIKKVKRKNDTYAIKTIREKVHLKSVQIYPIFISSCLVCARACYHTPPSTPIHGKHSFLFISIFVFFVFQHTHTHTHSRSAFKISNSCFSRSLCRVCWYFVSSLNVCNANVRFSFFYV